MILRTVVCFVGGLGIAAAAQPLRDEFAYEAPIVMQGTGSVFRAPLSAAVYQGVTRADLGDVRVYNSAGEIVPHGVVRPDVTPSKNPVALPLFPLVLDKDRAQTDVSLRVEVAKDGSIVKVQSDGRTEEAGFSYLIDASGIEGALSALELEWEDGAATGVVRNLTVDASADLKNWRTLGQGALARLEHDGQVLERKRVELPAQRVKYLRLVWSDPAGAPAVKSVKGEFTASIEPQRNWIAVARQPDTDASEYRFRLDGVMPVDRARVMLPANSVAHVAVLYRNKEGEAWMQAGQKTVYLLEASGGVVRDNEISLPGINAREWLLQFNKGSYQTAGLELGWVSHDLLFVARGAPPFHVAYGLAGLPAVDFGVAELQRLAARSNAERIDIGQAVLGTPRELKGETARTASWFLTSWRQWLLWAVLLAGVGVLAYLAVRLSRQMSGGATPS